MVLVRFFLILCLFTTLVFPGILQAAAPERRILLFPIGYYTPETSLALGGVMINNIDKVAEGKMSNVLTTLSYTAKSQTIFITKPKFYFDNGKSEITLTSRYFFYPSEYYGRGNETRKANRDLYTENNYSFDFGFRQNVWRDFYVGPVLGHRRQRVSRFKPGGLVEAEMKNGSNDFTHNHIGVAVALDTRDYPSAPKSGRFYSVTVESNWFADEFALSKNRTVDEWEMNLREYLPVGPNEVLALNAKYTKLDGHAIPFQYLRTLGGNENLRGYLAGRYRDKTLMMAQAEYRKEFHPRLAWATFAGVGVVGPDTDGALKNRRRHTVGAGIHFIADTESRQKFRLDVGLGEDDMGVYFIYGEAF